MSDEPTTAYIETEDGERVECLIERLGPREWQVVPVRDLTLEEVVSAWVDVVPSGATIGFLLGGDLV